MSQIGIVGDVHGCASQLAHLVSATDSLAEHLVFAGDYVNRGPESRQVLELLLTLQRSSRRVEFILGNHDAALLAAVDGTEFDAFLTMGGDATVRSYVPNIGPDVDREFRAAVPDTHVAFLRSLPTQILVGGGGLVQHDVSWPMDSPAPYILAGHHPQRSLRPFIGRRHAIVDTGCGTWPGAPLTCLFWPSMSWLQVWPDGRLTESP